MLVPGDTISVEMDKRDSLEVAMARMLWSDQKKVRYGAEESNYIEVRSPNLVC